MNDQASRSSDNTCSRCGLPRSQSGSFTFWIFKESRCQCSDAESDKSGITAVESKVEILDNRYELTECIGEGAIGQVFKGRDQTNGLIVAVKVLRKELAANQLAVQRLIREVSVASLLSNSNLGEVYGYGREKDGPPYLVMEYVEGKDLSKIIQAEGRLEMSRALDIFIQICSGLDCAHLNEIIHRDLKPGNVIIQTMKNGRERAVIVDFGFSKLLQDATDTVRLTREGEAFGSPAYMSPEQCLGEQLDARSDIYSFGCLMYEALTGKPPLLGENVLATVARQVRDMPLSMRVHSPQVPEEIDSIVMKCLSKEPILRYQTASDLRQDLDKVKHGVFETGPSTQKGSQARKTSRTDSKAKETKSLRTAGNTLDIKTLIVAVLVISAIVGGISAIAVWMLLQQHPSQGTETNSATNSATSKTELTPGISTTEPKKQQQPASENDAENKKENKKLPASKQTKQESSELPKRVNAVKKKKPIAVDSKHTTITKRTPAKKSPPASSSNWQQLMQLREHR